MKLSLAFAAVLVLAPAALRASGTTIGNARTCREGAIETFNESRGEGEPSRVASFVCRSGRMVSLVPAAAPIAAPGTCREGDVEHWSIESADGTLTQAYVCHSGRYLPVQGK